MAKIIFCGIDPGATGAVAFIFPDGSIQVQDYTKGDCYNTLAGIKAIGYQVRAVIEKQAPRPGNAAGATYQMGRNYQDWIAWFKILKVPFDEEVPTTWQKVVFDPGTRPKKVKVKKPEGMTDQQAKEFKKSQEKRGREHKKKLKLASVERAKRLYPHAGQLINRHDQAEALLIAHFCWLRYH